ncbi:MAG: histidinol-phosphatase HisJ family protein [Clostridia bacterium]|nr:histidinol-phosphatase HisJ family protein [Clostridia bacterium]
MFVDIHLHTKFSFDSQEEIENYVCAAKQAGNPAVGFSEHYDYDAVLDGENISVADIPKYKNVVNALRAKTSKPDILFGIEFGYRDISVSKYRELIEKYDFDYVINSVHTLKGRGDCFHDRFFEGKTLKESYSDYFQAVLESVKADFDYQIIGHVGYVSRYRTGKDAKILYSDFSEIIDEILCEIINRDKCLEINTSTGKSENCFLPDKDIIERYVRLGGKKLSFGSDAHKATDYLRRQNELCDFLKSLGVEQLYYYKKRQPIAYNI